MSLPLLDAIMVKGYEDNSDEKQTPSDVGYVLDNRRRTALAEVDNAKFSCVTVLRGTCMPSSFPISRRFHAKISIVAGAGAFTNA